MAEKPSAETEEAAGRRARGRPRSAWNDAPAAPVQALDRGLTLLRALARSGGGTLSEIAQVAEIPASTAHRLLATLELHGFVELDAPRQVWTVGLQAFRVGAAFARGADLVAAGRGVMRTLVEETGETANLALGDGGEVVFVSQVETSNPIRAFFRIGTRGPMHATGIGKALLAEAPPLAVERYAEVHGLLAFTPTTRSTRAALHADLEAIRARGYSVDDEERYAGMRCVAAAIHDAQGEAIAGVSVSGPKSRLGDGAVAEIGPKVCAAAAEVTRLLGGEPGRRERGRR